MLVVPVNTKMILILLGTNRSPLRKDEFEDDFSELPVVGYEMCDPFLEGNYISNPLKSFVWLLS